MAWRPFLGENISRRFLHEMSFIKIKDGTKNTKKSKIVNESNLISPYVTFF